MTLPRCSRDYRSPVIAPECRLAAMTPSEHAVSRWCMWHTDTHSLDQQSPAPRAAPARSAGPRPDLDPCHASTARLPGTSRHNGGSTDLPTLMYQSYFGLAEAPFSIAPDPRYRLPEPAPPGGSCAPALRRERRGGFVLLTGEVGAGKTTICRCLLDQIPASCDVAYVFNPKLTVEELLSTICVEFGIAYPPGNTSIKVFVDCLNEHLLAANARGRHTVLIIDEAQNLSADVLEQMRLLTNLETNKRKLLQIILLGQPELADDAGTPGIAPARAAHRCAVSPGSPEQGGGRGLRAAPPRDRRHHAAALPGIADGAPVPVERRRPEGHQRAVRSRAAGRVRAGQGGGRLDDARESRR